MHAHLPKLRLLAATLLASGACATAAHAQPGQERRLDITAAGRMQYDSNVLRASNHQEVTSRGHKSDIRYTPSLDLDIYVPLSRQAVFLGGSIGYDFYQRNSRLNRERIGLRGGTDYQFGRCSGQLAASYHRQLSDLSDFYDPQTGDLLSGDNTEENRAVDFSIGCSRAFGLRPSFSAGYAQERNSGDYRRRGNNNSYYGQVGIGYVGPSFGQLSVIGRYSRISYPHRFGFDGTRFIKDGVEVKSVGLAYDREIGARLRGSASLTYTWVDPKLPGTRDFNGLSWSSDLSWQGNAMLLSGGVSRSVSPSNLIDVSYEIQERYYLDSTYAVNQAIRLNAGVSYSKRRFGKSPAVPVLFPRGNDKTYQANAGVSYKFRRRLSLGADVIREWRRSNVSLFDYNSTRVGVNARVTF